MNSKREDYKNFLIFFLYLIFLTVSSLMPGSGESSGIPGIDKIFHFLFYLILGFLSFKPALSLFSSQRLANILFLCIFLTTAYGLLMEYLQGFVPFRSPEAADAVANFSGALSGTYLACLIFKGKLRNGKD